MSDFNLGSEASGGGSKRGIERFASLLLLGLAFLIPVFFIPAVSFPFQSSKALLLAIVVIVVFAFWLVARLKDGKFVIPNSPILLSLCVVVVLSILSSLFSGSIGASLLGQGFEVGTTINILILAVLAFLIPVFFRSKEQIFGSYLAFLASFFLIALFHLLRLVFGPGFLSLGILTDTVSNTIGKWNDLGVFFGAATILSLVTIEFLSLSRLFRGLIYLALIISLFFLAVINFSTVWFTLGVFSLIFLVYLISFGKKEEVEEVGEAVAQNRRIPVPSLVVLLISVVFIFAGGRIGNQLSTSLNISQVEARPSWSATFEVAKQTLNEDPLLGSGPNQFSQEWLKWKPAGINNTIFWNTDFSYGVGLIPTFLATNGILGILAWIAFFLLFLYSGFKAILSTLSDQFAQYIVTSSFLVSLFLWIFSIFYIPSQTIFALTFLFTGLFVASLITEKFQNNKTISFIDDPRAGFVSVLILILLLIGSVTLGYTLVEKYTATVLFQKGVISFNTNGDIDKAENLIGRAVAMSPQDIYYRFLTELTLIRMNTLLGQDTSTVSADTVRTEFQSLLGVALDRARQAVALNPKNYENLMTLGRVYESVVPIDQAAYDSARTIYEQAFAQNPHSPAIILTLARLEVAKGDNAKAREEIVRALQEKNNYTEAIFLLSQIEVQEGNIKAAISSVEAASAIAPNDSGVFFQLGLLRFNDSDFQGAVSALERATTLNPNYANAKYFLGLSYEKVGRDEDAIAEFTDLSVANPDSEEVSLILANLKAGRAPFSNATPPVDDKPEKRSTLPVKEDAQVPGEE